MRPAQPSPIRTKIELPNDARECRDADIDAEAPVQLHKAALAS